jgi:hypothetical protein
LTPRPPSCLADGAVDINSLAASLAPLAIVAHATMLA